MCLKCKPKTENYEPSAKYCVQWPEKWWLLNVTGSVARKRQESSILTPEAEQTDISHISKHKSNPF